MDVMMVKIKQPIGYVNDLKELFLRYEVMQ